MTRIHPRALAAAGTLSLGALLLSGCASSTSTTATAAQPSASASGNAQSSAYRDCLSKHGVTMPAGRPSGGFSRNPSDRPSRNPSDRPSGGNGGGGFGGFGGGGASADPATQAAIKACASLAPAGGFGGRGAAGSTATAAFTSCLKDHGVTLPANGGVRALNTADPKTAAAYKTCKPLLPAPGSGSGAPGATSSPTG